jgi:hypothetical protein
MRVINEEGNALIVRRALRQLMATGAFGPGRRSASGVRWLGSGYEADVFAFSLAPAPRRSSAPAPLRSATPAAGGATGMAPRRSASRPRRRAACERVAGQTLSLIRNTSSASLCERKKQMAAATRRCR